jgi:hypothetical protein
MRSLPPRLALSLALCAAATPRASACGACGCTLHTDWASQGLSTGAGFRLDLRFDYFAQDQLRAGRNSVDRGSFQLPNDREIQQRTLNRNTTLGLDYSPDGLWGFTALLPCFDRTHETLAPGDAGISSSRGAGVGDLRLMARYQGFQEDRALGVQVGVKLPTGRTRDTFIRGPQTGEPLDRGLQLGTGTTDLLLGGYASVQLAGKWGGFAQAMYQVPGAEKDGFRPGNGLNLNAGVRYQGSGTFTPQLQVNLRTEKPETGENADARNSGATLAYLSPGLTVGLGEGIHFSAFVQVPIYQRVNGLQLEPRLLASCALHWTF